MNGSRLLLAGLATFVLLSGCGYNIIPDPPATLPRADGQPLPMRVAVRDVALANAQQNSEGSRGSSMGMMAAANANPQEVSRPNAERLVDALRKSNLFRDVERIGALDVATGFDAVVRVNYKDTTDQKSIGFIFPPCLIPFLDLCIIPLGKTRNAIGAELSVAVDNGAGQTIRSYSETASGECNYVPFPGLFPFNLALIIGGPETSCHQVEGPRAAFDMAAAKLVGDLVRDRQILAQGARRGAEPSEESRPEEGNSNTQPAAPAGAGSGQKPWWQQ